MIVAAFCAASIFGGVGNERVDETIAALARGRVRDLRQRLARSDLRFEVGFSRTEVRSRCFLWIAGHLLAGSAAEARPGTESVRGVRARADALLVDERRDVLLLCRRKRGDEPVARLAVRDRHVGEALVSAKFGPELRLGDPDVRRRGCEVRALVAEPVPEHLANGLVPDLRDRRGSATAGKEGGCREPAGEAEPDDCRDEKRFGWLDRFHAVPFPRSCYC